jgi:hypothetical protein
LLDANLGIQCHRVFRARGTKPVIVIMQRQLLNIAVVDYNVVAGLFQTSTYRHQPKRRKGSFIEQKRGRASY